MGNTRPRPTAENAGNPANGRVSYRADDEIRTRDPHLGKGCGHRPYSPSTALQYSTVQKTVRPVRLFRPVRIPVYHHTRARCGSARVAPFANCLRPPGAMPPSSMTTPVTPAPSTCRAGRPPCLTAIWHTRRPRRVSQRRRGEAAGAVHRLRRPSLSTSRSVHSHVNPQFPRIRPSLSQ